MLGNTNPNHYTVYVDGDSTLHCMALENATKFAIHIQCDFPLAEVAILDNRADEFIAGFAQRIKVREQVSSF